VKVERIIGVVGTSQRKKKNPVHDKRQGWEPIHKKYS
jgi:hypothetical protein